MAEGNSRPEGRQLEGSEARVPKARTTDPREAGVATAHAESLAKRMAGGKATLRRARTAFGRELLVAVMLATAAAALDMRIAERQNNLQTEQARAAEQLQVEQFDESERRENLRFVRDRASDDSRPRPFGGMDLRGTSLFGLDLSCPLAWDEGNGNLVGSGEACANFTDANLSLVTASDAKLSGANFYNTNLREADLSGSDLAGSFFNAAQLQGASLHGASLGGADASGAYLANADLSNATLSGAKFQDAELGHSNLSGASLDGTSFTRADLRQADLTGASFATGDLTDADLEGADLTDATLEEVNITGADFTDAELRGAKWQGVCGKPAKWPHGFQPPTIRSCPVVPEADAPGPP